MAGHSKWAQIKRSKAVKDARRGAVFARLSREIMVAARMAGGDPAANFRLRTAIEKAKAAALPADNIARAIDKGCGRGEADTTENLIYEGYGPGGAAILIVTMTDNRNRTAGDIRSYFNKYAGNLGADGCVAWMFEEFGQIRLAAITEEAPLMDVALQLDDCQDVAEDEEGAYLVTPPLGLNKVCQQLTQLGHAVASAELTRHPLNTVAIDTLEHAKPLVRLLNALDDHDDVQTVVTNAVIEDALLQQLEAWV
jgi:YebC/PmpR family DNA-binding regulatory protein